jgi:hypothetical protein
MARRVAAVSRAVSQAGLRGESVVTSGAEAGGTTRRGGWVVDMIGSGMRRIGKGLAGDGAEGILKPWKMTLEPTLRFTRCLIGL